MKAIVDYDKYTHLLRLVAKATGYLSYSDDIVAKSVSEELWKEAVDALNNIEHYYPEN